MKICVDPGHGGSDPGASYHGCQEAYVNLDIAKHLADFLRRLGHTVIMTRTSNTNVSLMQRCATANQAGADLFISIHCNASGTSDPQFTAAGIETWVYAQGGQAEKLATLVQKMAVAFTGAKDRGVRVNPKFYVLRKTAMPAVLIECGFVSNYTEATLLNDHTYRIKLAAAIAAGVELLTR